MRIQGNQERATNAFLPFNTTAKANIALNQPHCPTHSLALFALRGQSVNIESSLIDNAKAAIAKSRQLHFTRQIKESGVIIQAFLDKGLADTEKAKMLTNALKSEDCDLIEAMWNDFISDAMNSLVETLNNHTKTALKNVPNIDELLASVNKDYSLFDLSIEQNIGGQACDLVFQNTDFLCHIPTDLFAIENKTLQHFYKKLLDQSLVFGGVWQEDLIHIGFMEQWTSNKPREITAAEKLLVEITTTSAAKIDAVIRKARKKKSNDNIFSVLDEMIELQFCGDTSDQDDFKEWLGNEIENLIEMNRLSIRLNEVSQGKYKLSDCPPSLITEQIKALLNVSREQLGGTMPTSFELDEDNFSHLTFVLKNDEENLTLNKVSQEQFEQFCNAGEDSELYRLDVSNGHWLDDLKEVTLALNILFVGINAMLDSLPENKNV